MRTVKLPVVFGYAGRESGDRRIEIPDNCTRSSLVRRGALHGPGNENDAIDGIGFQLLWKCQHGGYNFYGVVSVVD